MLCKACGDSFNNKDFEDLSLTKDETERLRPLLGTHCEECAREKALQQLDPHINLQHGSGGGRRVIRDARGL